MYKLDLLKLHTSPSGHNQNIKFPVDVKNIFYYTIILRKALGGVRLVYADSNISLYTSIIISHIIQQTLLKINDTYGCIKHYPCMLRKKCCKLTFPIV